MYASSLASGLMPDQFWDMTFHELNLWRSSIVEKEKLEWRRLSASMALLYNLNRGKGKSMTASDFFPFEEENQTKLESTDDVQDLASDVEKLRQSIINKNQDNG